MIRTDIFRWMLHFNFRLMLYWYLNQSFCLGQYVPVAFAYIITITKHLQSITLFFRNMALIYVKWKKSNSNRHPSYPMRINRDIQNSRLKHSSLWKSYYAISSNVFISLWSISSQQGCIAIPTIRMTGRGMN